LIAKGAIFAKQAMNNDAIIEFEKVLKIDSNNPNAKKYYDMVKIKLSNEVDKKK